MSKASPNLVIHIVPDNNSAHWNPRRAHAAAASLARQDGEPRAVIPYHLPDGLSAAAIGAAGLFCVDNHGDRIFAPDQADIVAWLVERADVETFNLAIV